MPYNKRKAKKRAKGKRLSATESLDAAPQEDLLVPLAPGSGTFEKSVLPVLQNCYFYPESGSSLQYSGPHLVKNHAFQNEYQSFHAEKLEQGYTEQELKESFGFLVFDQLEKAQDVCERGLRVGHSSCSTLGDPSKGVYVLMHSDCLGLSSDCNEKSGFILILRLTKGRARPVQESCAPPTAGFDCHVWEPITDESTSSSALPLEQMQYYLYERKGTGIVRPRQVLPFALVAFTWTRTLQEESSPATAAFHFHPWRGQLQIKSLVYHVTLRSDTEAAIPIQLPPVLVIDRVMKVSALRRLLSPSVFETRLSCDVSQEGRFFSLYEVVVTSLVRGSSLAVLTLELKKKELALVLPLNDFGFLVLLSSTYFLKYQGKAGTLLAMFVFPDSRAVKEGTKILRSTTSLLPDLLHILPGLRYAETEVAKCPPDQGEALCDMVEQHLQRYSTVDQPGMPVDLSGDHSGLQDQYDTAELENHDQSGRKSRDVTLQLLQTYLGKPGAYTLPVGRAKELVAVRQEQQEDNIDKDGRCCFSHPEDTPPALTSLCGEGVSMPGGDDAAAESVSSLPKDGEDLAGGNPSLKLVIRPIYKRRHSRKWKRKKRKRSRLQPVDEHLGQDDITEARPEAKQLVPLRRKGFNYGLKTIITDCGKMFIPHGSEVLPKDIASLEERQRVASQCPEQMVCGLPGSVTLPKELADLQAPDDKKVDEGSLDPKQAEQPAQTMDSANELRTGVPESTMVSPEVEGNELKNSGTGVIPSESSTKGIKGYKPIISFQELRTVFQNLERKLKCPDGQTLDRFDPGLADGEPQQKKVKVDGCTEEFLGFGKVVSPRGANSPEPSPKMTNLSDSDLTLSELLGKQRRTDGLEKTPPRRTSSRRQDSLGSAPQPDQSLQAEKNHGLPATTAKPAKPTQFKKPRGSRSDVNSKGNGPLKCDKSASRGSESADRPQPQELKPGELQVCRGGASPVLEPDSTSACQPADALTLLADLALGSSGGKPPKNLRLALIEKLVARRHRPIRPNLPPRSPAPEGLIVSGQFIPLISEEHSYAASLTHGPPKHSLHGLVETSPQGEPVQCAEPLDQETSNAPQVTNPSRRTVPPQHPVTERRKRGSRWTRSVVQVGEKICVTRPWKEKYEFGQDSRYNSEPAVKAVLRALHGPWNFGIEESFQQKSLILHIWIGLFYSKSTARFFPDDPNESGPLILKARKKSQGGEALPAGASSSMDPLGTEEVQGCALAPQCPEEFALDLTEGSKRVADPSDPCPAALDLSKKRSEALDLSVASKHGSGICPPSSTNKIFPKNSLIPLPPPAPCSYTHIYVRPLRSKYPEFVHKDYRPRVGIMSDDESEQEDDGTICPEGGCGVNWDSGILEPVQSSSDSGYAEICEHTASLDISQDNVFGDTETVDGNFCSDGPLQSLDRERDGWTELPQPVGTCCTSTETAQEINICPTATEVLPTVDTQCAATEDLHPINGHHATTKDIELMEASNHEFKGIVATAGHEWKDLSKTDHAAVYDGNNVTTVNKFLMEHDGINVYNEEMSAAGCDGNDFASNEGCAVVNDGNKEEAGPAEYDGGDVSNDEMSTEMHDGIDFSKKETSIAVHDGTDFPMNEGCAVVNDGNKEGTGPPEYDSGDFSKDAMSRAVHVGIDFSKKETSIAVHDGTDFSMNDGSAVANDGNKETGPAECDGIDFTNEMSTAAHDGIDPSEKETSIAVHDGNEFDVNKGCAIVNDGNKEEASPAQYNSCDSSEDEISTAVHDGIDFSKKENSPAVHDESDLRKEHSERDEPDFKKAEECTVWNEKGEEKACPVEHVGSDIQKPESSTEKHDAGDFCMVEQYTAAHGGSNVHKGEALKTICDVTGMHDVSRAGEIQTAISNQDDCSILPLEENVNQSPTLTQDDVSPELNFVLSDSQSGSPESENCFLNEEYDSRSATPTLDEPCDDLGSFTNDSCSKEIEDLSSREIDSVDAKLKPESSACLPQSGNIPCSSTMRICSQAPSSILDEVFSSSPASEKYSEDCPTSRLPLNDKFSSNSCGPSEDLPLHAEPTSIHSQVCRPHDQELLKANERNISVTDDSNLPVMSSLDSLHRNLKASSQGEPSHDGLSSPENDHDLGSSLQSVANHQHATVPPSKDNLHPPNPHQLETTEFSLSCPASDGTSSVGPKAIEESQGTVHEFSSDSEDGNMVQLVNSNFEVLPNGNNRLLSQISDPCLSGTSPQRKLSVDCLRLPHQSFSDCKDVPSDSELLSDSEPSSSSNCRNTRRPADSGSICPSDQGSMTGEPEPTGTSALSESLRHGCWNYKKCDTPGSTRNPSVSSSSSRPHAHYEQPGKSPGTYRRRQRKGGGGASLGMARMEIKNPLHMGDDNDPASQYTTAWDLRKRLAQEEEQYTMLGDQESLSSGSFFSANEGEDSCGSLGDEDAFEEQDSDEALDYSKSGPYNICSDQCDGMVPRMVSCSPPHRVNDTEVMDQFWYRRSKSQRRMQTDDVDEFSAFKQPVFSSLHCRESRPPYKYHPITRTVPNKPSGAAQIGGSRSSHLNCLPQKWEEPRPTEHDLTQASLNLQYLIFAEKMNQVLKNHQVSAEPSGSARYVWRKRSPSHVDCSPCDNSGTLQISRHGDRISEEPIRKRRGKRKGLGALEFSTSCSPIDATPHCLGRLSDAESFSESCSAVSNIGDECQESYRATMNDVWLGRKHLHRPNKLRSERILQPQRTCLRNKKKEGNSLHSDLRATNRQSCKGKFRFYIMVTSTDAFFEQTKELLEAEGHLNIEPDNFDLEGRSAPSPLLVIVRNEDIADHLCTIPHLLDLKQSPEVLFAGVDQPDDVINHTYQELLRDGGFTVCDADTLSSITLGDVRRLIGTLEELNASSKWKWFLHYKDSRELRERARRSSEARRLKQYVDRCQEVGLVEVMPYHECDVITRDRPEYLRCLVHLQVQYTASRFPVFITETPEDSFGKCGILAMNLNTFLRFFRSYNIDQNLNCT